MNSERAQLEQTILEHYDAPVDTAHSLPAAQKVVNRVKVINKPVPLPVQRFMDRMSAPKGEKGRKDKLARDLHGVADYNSLSPDKQSGVDEISNALAWHNPAIGHRYNKAGLTLAQGWHILIATYKEIGAMRGDYPQDVRHSMSDFASGLEKDLQQSAKSGGFYAEYSSRQKDVRDAIQNRLRGTQ